jgi:mannosyltransferase OCH1-like enzyme
MLKILILCSILILVIIFFVIFMLFKKEDYASFLLKKNNVIPLNIYMTWHTKKIPFSMKQNISNIKRLNPEFKIHLYDEEECRDFIKNNFDSIVLNSYDNLIPKAYKADLWRYCILYKKGGIYMDVKLEPINNFKFIELIDQEYLVLDRPYDSLSYTIESDIEYVNSSKYIYEITKIKNNDWWQDFVGIYNALIIVKPNNQLLQKCINNICNNVSEKEYGYNALYPTGPGMMGELYFSNEYIEKLKSLKLFNTREGTHIITKEKPILSHYKDYRKEQTEKHHGYLWNKKKIYL